MKPRIFWTHYPKLGRGYWRVDQMPKYPTPGDNYAKLRKRWVIAHNIAAQMNAAITFREKQRQFKRKLIHAT